ncbi:hypothetical protein SAMN02927921_00607 [Sinomicrobium oceani]|uniref:Prepilin-type N-terminal cleavage/methylation domain-containing protein n=1 Tax=Sinomicrobium oceani TaxID=1150368 RepID=A0A1K1MEA2_9FLAO|nr:hypothetical protein [Sinomicrobium oceani]SFW21458.1 hypothetical protein SAMN02927921_00607 [Sinomicrobium oceani]
MALLKKKYPSVRASTLMETLVATVLIVVIFMVTSLILNNLFSGSLKENTRNIDMRLEELSYTISRHRIKVPYDEEAGNWIISASQDRPGSVGTYRSSGGLYKEITLQARETGTDRIITRKVVVRNEAPSH